MLYKIQIEATFQELLALWKGDYKEVLFKKASVWFWIGITVFVIEGFVALVGYHTSVEYKSYIGSLICIVMCCVLIIHLGTGKSPGVYILQYWLLRATKNPFVLANGEDNSIKVNYYRSFVTPEKVTAISTLGEFEAALALYIQMNWFHVDLYTQTVDFIRKLTEAKDANYDTLRVLRLLENLKVMSQGYGRDEQIAALYAPMALKIEALRKKTIATHELLQTLPV